jgi:hypothetical protein
MANPPCEFVWPALSVWKWQGFDRPLSGVDAFTRSGVSGRAVGRNHFIAPAAFQDPRRLRGDSEGVQ